jgi:hypothetical protein
LGIATAPVVLLDRGANTPQNQERYVGLIAWAFEPAHSWEEAAQVMTQPELEKCAADVSAVLPFEAWIAAQDRGGKHLLVSLPNTGDTPQTSNIDYAFSMLDSWGNDPKHPAVGKPNWSAPVTIDQTAIKEVVERIEQFSSTEIEQIVGRVPEEFLPADKKAIIIANLLNRQQKIRPVYFP